MKGWLVIKYVVSERYPVARAKNYRAVKKDESKNLHRLGARIYSTVLLRHRQLAYAYQTDVNVCMMGIG